MQATSRIPKLSATTFDGALLWLSQLQNVSQLFHPEDDPDSIYRISNDQKLFTDSEVSEIRAVIDKFETGIGHKSMIEAAYPDFVKVLNLQLNA